MRGKLSAWVASRYLYSRKSSGAVRAISMVAVCGIAVATAAIVCVLSVFNGFRSVMSEKQSQLSPDVLVTPASGKTISSADSVAAVIAAMDGVASARPGVSDNALALYKGQEMPVTLKGVDVKAYRQTTGIDTLMRDDGRFMNAAQSDSVALSVGVAYQLGIGGAGGEELLLFAPKRLGRVNMANPLGSFITDSVGVSGVYQSLHSDYDETMVICDIATARRLFQYDDEATEIEVTSRPGADAAVLADKIEAQSGGSLVAKDRVRQQDVNFRMVAIEKWVTFLLLFFILIIASFNIISAMCMVVIEKERSLKTFRALGLESPRLGLVFGFQSLYVTLIGGLAGLALGLTLCLLQESYGLIKLGGDASGMIMSAYPVKVEATDIAAAAVPIIVVGLACGWISSAFARSRISVQKES